MRLNRCNLGAVDTSRLATESSPGSSTENKTRRAKIRPTLIRDNNHLVVRNIKPAPIAPAASEPHEERVGRLIPEATVLSPSGGESGAVRALAIACVGGGGERSSSGDWLSDAMSRAACSSPNAYARATRS